MIISIMNNKGGVGKSTITQSLGHALANKGKRVLVIDQDPQANTTSVLFSDPVGENSLFDIYSRNAPVENCIYPTDYDGLFIIPNINETGTIEVSLYNDVHKSYFLLKDSVREYAEANFDFTLIDNPPNLGMFCMMSLVASDSAIIPIMAGSRYSVDGFKTAYDAIEAVSASVPHGLKFLKAVINLTDLRELASKTSIAFLRQKFGDKIFETTIPRNTDVLKAETERKTVIRYAPQSTAARRFKVLAEEILEFVG